MLPFHNSLFYIVILQILGSCPAYGWDLRPLEHCSFINRELVTPGELSMKKGLPISLPHSWESDKSLKLRGFGTYVCEIDFQNSNGDRSILFPYISEAYRVWINGHEVLKRGQVSIAAESVVDYPRSIALASLPDAAHYQIVIQVSSFSGAWSGLSPSPLMGNTNEISQTLTKDFGGFIFALAMCLLFFIFNITLYFHYLRDRSAFFLSAITFSCIIRYLFNKPYHIFHYLYSSFPTWISWKLEYLAFVGMGVFFFKLVGVQLKQPFVRLEKFITIFGAVYALVILLTPVGFYRQFLLSWQFICLTEALFTFLIAIRAFSERLAYTTAISFGLLCWALLGGLEIINSSIFRDENFVPYGMYGFLIFCFVNSYVISLKNAYAHRVLKKQKALSVHAFNQLKKIVYPHQLGLMKLGLDLEQTMPTGISEAVVVSFDIENSSKIKRVDVEEFLEAAIASCIALMQENYDPHKIQSNAYRIAELGDGFLCSVGYPFKVPNDADPAHFAVELALRFISLFQGEVEKLDYEQPIFCSVGIAKGSVQGYYPSTGTKEYSVRGRGLVLATRYEGMRKVVFSELSNHVVLIQAQIFHSLSADLQKRFLRLSAHEEFAVRDDYEATELFYLPVAS